MDIKRKLKGLNPEIAGRVIKRQFKKPFLKERTFTEKEIKKMANDFNLMYYKHPHSSNWFGYSIMKYPTDLMVYQEIIFETKPDLIIETGTWKGGSTLYLAHLLELLGKGKVISVDIMKGDYPRHNRITYLTGSSTSRRIFNRMKQEAKGKKVLVILDSEHGKSHVLKELKMYSPLVNEGSYIIVEDTNINGHPVAVLHGLGPYEAVEEFIKNSDDFEIDKSREKFLITTNPNGFLRKKKKDEYEEEKITICEDCNRRKITLEDVNRCSRCGGKLKVLSLKK